MKAYSTIIDGMTEGFIAALTPSKARYVAYKSLREAGYTETGQFHNITIRRRPEYDKWAQTAQTGRVYGYDYMPPKEMI